MSDAAALMYPTHTAPAPSPPGPAQPAAGAPAPTRTAPASAAPEEALARLLYPSMEPEPEPVPAAAAAAAPAVSAPAVSPAAPAEPGAEPAAVSDIIETRGAVHWSEETAEAGDIEAIVHETWPVTGELTQPERRQRAAFATALVEMGAGATSGREIIQDIETAERAPIATTSEQAMAALKAVWGSRTDANLAAAKAVIGKMEAAYPGTKAFLDQTGLGNSPGFIRKIAARAAALAKRAPAR